MRGGSAGSRWLGNLAHLGTRWWLAVTAGPPQQSEEEWAVAHLMPEEHLLWRQMCDQDRFHAVQVTKRFLMARPEATRAEIAGALLHDVGKIATTLGTSGRVFATIISPALVPSVGPLKNLRSRWQRYREHEEIGVEMAILAGSDEATIEMMRGVGTAARDLKAADHI